METLEQSVSELKSEHIAGAQLNCTCECEGIHTGEWTEGILEWLIEEYNVVGIPNSPSSPMVSFHSGQLPRCTRQGNLLRTGNITSFQGSPFHDSCYL